MAFLTVPLTMLAVSSLSPKDIPQGASLNNMMRQLGGAFGISAVNTYAARRLAVHRTDLLENITATNPEAVNRLNSYTSYFQQKGIGLADAHQKGMEVIDRVVVKQSTLLSYADSYFMIGLLFALALPLLLFVVKAPKSTAPKMILSDH